MLRGDFAALARKAVEGRTFAAIGYLNLLYPVAEPQTVVTRFAEACGPSWDCVKSEDRPLHDPDRLLHDPDLLPSARLWKFLLEDLHPELEVNLHEEDVGIGV